MSDWMERAMILVLVFIGSALTAAGGLYFINIKFCKDPVQAIAMLVGGLVMVAGGEIAVTGSRYFVLQGSADFRLPPAS